MPELPEVETTRRGLLPVLEGRVLTRVETRRADLRFPFPEGFAARLTGRRVIGLERRAKYILARLDDGAVWMIHLGMSGRLQVGVGPAVAAAPHDHVLIETDAGGHVIYNDARRFGFMDLFPADALAAHPRLVHLGLEPLGDGFTGAALAARLTGRLTSIKAALMDQRIVVGVGNIYTSEALHRAGVSPRRLAGSCTGRRAERLVQAIRAVLAEAIAAGGSSLRDYVQTSGELGYFQHAWRVYGRAGEPCRRHERVAIRRIVQAGRASYYCPACQR